MENPNWCKRHITWFLRKAAASSLEHRLVRRFVRSVVAFWFAAPRTPPLWQCDFFLVNCSVLRQLLASERSGVVKTFRCQTQMPEFDWSKYEAMRDSDASPHDVYRAAVADGFRPFPECIKMLIDVFGVTLARAKEIYLQADGIAESLDEYQESLAPTLEEALKTIDDDENWMDT